MRLRAESAFLRQLNQGYGFSDSGGFSDRYLFDDELRARVGHHQLRPQNTHQEQYAQVERELAQQESVAFGGQSPLADLQETLELTSAELVVVGAALAFEVDPDFRALCGALSGRRPSALYADVLVQICPEFHDVPSVIETLSAGSQLRQVAVSVEDSAGPGFSRIALWPLTLHWLLGREPGRNPLADTLFFPNEERDPTYLPETLTQTLSAIAERLVSGRGSPVVFIRGGQGSGRQACARHIANTLGRGLIVFQIAKTITSKLVDEVLRVVYLTGAALYLPNLESMNTESAAITHLKERLVSHKGLVFVAGDSLGIATVSIGRPFISVSVPHPDYALRKAAWRHSLAHLQVAIPDQGADELASRYVMGPAAIAAAISEANEFANAESHELCIEQIEAACARRVRVRLGKFGNLVARKATFDEMVIPSDVGDALRNMIAMVSKRALILEQWGFEKHLGMARGISALFSGEPGTGKTMAASVIAGALGLELMRVDLSAVSSKWVGETEKHLAQIFGEAQNANAMLLFDEADSLFGKRTEVKSAQDRYANTAVNYILQRIETFDGICVLTTNFENTIDKAFLRRLNFRVRFPEPERQERLLLWQKLLPKETGIANDVDFSMLADKFEMAGGYIRNAIVRAAVLAAREGRELLPKDLLRGAHEEYTELGKVMPSLD